MTDSRSPDPPSSVRAGDPTEVRAFHWLAAPAVLLYPVDVLGANSRRNDGPSARLCFTPQWQLR